MDFSRDGEADVAEADDAKGVAARVVRDGRDLDVGFVEAGWGKGARGEGGPG